MRRLFLLLPLALAGCGTLPQPFYGNPGPEGAKLAVPPPPILMIPPPGQALLPADSAKLYAGDLAAAFVALDVPASARPAQKFDWRLVTTASLHGNAVIPHYEVLGPSGKRYGSEAGAPVDAASWADGNPQALKKAADADALKLCKLLARINAAVQQSNPDSLENRPARVYLGRVTGAPTDGDDALALDLSRDLPGPGLDLVDKPADADFRVTGTVKTSPEPHGQILVQIIWTVQDTGNRVMGQVTQLHVLNPADITPHWGDVAAAAAKQDASGVQEVISNATLHRQAGKGD